MEKAIDLIRNLAEAIGQTVEMLWPHAVRYIAIEAIAWVSIFIVPVIILLVVVYHLRDDEWSNAQGESTARTGWTIVLGLSILGLLISIGANAARILEPAGYVVLDIVGR